MMGTTEIPGERPISPTGCPIGQPRNLLNLLWEPQQPQVSYGFRENRCEKWSAKILWITRHVQRVSLYYYINL